MFNQNFIRAIFFVLIIGFSGCSGFLFHKEPAYVKVNNGKFELDGKPYYFVGANMWYGCYIGSAGITGDRERLERELDILVENGITNLRVLAASENSNIQNSVKPAIQQGPGVYNEEILDGLDYLLSEMGERDMHAVVFLNNYWEWSGGMSQYNAWANNETAFDPENPNQGWSGFMDYSATFYKNEKANELYRNFVKKLITRKNNYSGLYYFEDPAIMSWQLANEPRPGRDNDGAKNKEAFCKWIDETAAFIHSLDKNHLVTTGNEGLMGSIQSEEIYLTAHQSKNIDYITFHLWPKNWGWFDPNRIDETFTTTVTRAVDYINKHIQYARQLNKPITLEEFGMARDSALLFENSSVTARDKYFSVIYKTMYDSAAAGAPMAGSNFWAWSGEGRGKNPDGKWRTGDPFMGDPFQEPQGYNSVFHTDISTLKIIKEFSEKMKSIGKQ